MQNGADASDGRKREASGGRSEAEEGVEEIVVEGVVKSLS